MSLGFVAFFLKFGIQGEGTILPLCLSRMLTRKHAPKQTGCFKMNPVMPILQLDFIKKIKLNPKYVVGEIKDEVTIVLTQGLYVCVFILCSWISA